MIDEKMLIEMLNKNYFFKTITNSEGKNVYDIIKEQPKVNEWIPVEERLPEEYEIVLVAYLEYISNTKQLCGIAYIDECRTWTWYFNGTDVRNEILAWMPLPKPYRKDV